MDSAAGFLEALCASFAVHGPGSFSVFGVRHVAERPDAGPLRAAECARTKLAEEIYARLHCRLPGNAFAREARGGERVDAREFTRLLSMANAGRGSWQAGWLVRAVELDGRVVAESLGVRFWCSAAECRAGTEGVRAGAPVHVFVPKEYRQLMPGFYMVTGDADDDLHGAPSLRVYWNVTAHGAVALAERLMRGLNAAQVAFRFKVPSDPRNFGRADAAVLYLHRERFSEVRSLLAEITAAARPTLTRSTSAFVKTVAPGVGIAEDPGEGASFGQHRSALLADALLTDESASADSVSARATVVRHFLHVRGYAADALFLDPGSRDVYGWGRDAGA